MVCIRCEMVVKAELEKAGIKYASVKIGEVELLQTLTPDEREQFNEALKKTGLALLDDKKSQLVERVKQVIIEMVHYTEERVKVNLSEYLSQKLAYDYTYLANLFSEVKGTTIEQFFILQRIERAKEMLVYDELNLIQIADILHFSSSSHLCRQFKKVTGLTPSHFKKLKQHRRETLENV